MDRREFLELILAESAVFAAKSHAGLPYSNEFEIMEKMAEEREKEKNLGYYALKDWLDEFTKKYLEGLREKQSGLERAIRHFGYEEIFKFYNSFNIDALNYARERIGKEAKQEDEEKKYSEIALRFIEGFKKYSAGKPANEPIDYSRQEINNQYIRWAKWKTEYYFRLIKSGTGAKNYNELVRKNFIRDEYKKLIDEQNVIIRDVYKSILDARVGFFGLFAGGQIRESRDFIIRYCEKSVEEIFPEKR